MILEGTYDGFYANPTLTYGRTFTVSYAGPEPYDKTHASATSFVANALEQIQIGKRVRITVEEIE